MRAIFYNLAGRIGISRLERIFCQPEKRLGRLERKAISAVRSGAHAAGVRSARARLPEQKTRQRDGRPRLQDRAIPPNFSLNRFPGTPTSSAWICLTTCWIRRKAAVAAREIRKGRCRALARRRTVRGDLRQCGAAMGSRSYRTDGPNLSLNATCPWQAPLRSRCLTISTISITRSDAQGRLARALQRKARRCERGARDDRLLLPIIMRRWRRITLRSISGAPLTFMRCPDRTPLSNGSKGRGCARFSTRSRRTKSRLSSLNIATRSPSLIPRLPMDACCCLSRACSLWQ